MEASGAQQDTIQRACDTFASYLVDQGYRVAQDLVGDSRRVVFVGRRSGACVVAEIQLGATFVEVDGARSIVVGLKSMMDRHKATNSAVAFVGPAELNSDARQIVEEAGAQLLEVDLANGRVIAF